MGNILNLGCVHVLDGNADANYFQDNIFFLLLDQLEYKQEICSSPL